MLSFPGSLRIYVALEPCDMRKSFSTPSKLGVSSGCNSHPGKENEPFHPESSLGLIKVTI